MFLASLSDLSNKSVVNAHVALSALWTWASGKGWCPVEHRPRGAARPRRRSGRLMPFGKQDVQAMLTACDRSKAYARLGNAVVAINKRPTAPARPGYRATAAGHGDPRRGAVRAGDSRYADSGQSPGGGDGPQGQEGTAHPGLVAHGAGAVAVHRLSVASQGRQITPVPGRGRRAEYGTGGGCTR